MADYAKINDVPAANIASYANVPKANIANVGGAITTPSSGATMWALCSTDMYISWVNAADVADVTAWEGNIHRLESSSADSFDIAYGLDSNGGSPMWMTIWNAGADEIKFDANNDITDESTWSTHNIHADYGGARQSTIVYGAGDGTSDSSSGGAVTRVGCWLAAGRTTSGNSWVHRSVDGGSNWTHLNLEGLTNLVGATGTDNYMTGLASDGLGNWMVGWKGNLYLSTDSAVSFSFLIQPTGNGTHLIRDIAYTNGTWVVISKNGSALQVATCAGSTAANMDASGDWSSAVVLEDASSNGLNGNVAQIRAAAAGGRVVVIDTARTLAFTVNGKNNPVIQGTRQDMPDEGNLNCISTDGTTWLAGSDGGSSGADGGDVCRSLDGGESWTKICEGINSSGDRKIEGIAANIIYPI
tara:strand:- start:443 stop:1684 length:1242 start_codon:yes stop_codon:yes gene_type:complete